MLPNITDLMTLDTVACDEQIGCVILQNWPDIIAKPG